VNTKLHSMQLGLLILLAAAMPIRAHQSKPPAQTTSPAAADASAKPDAQAKPPVPPDTVVLKVGDEKIPAADMQAMIKSMPPQVQRMVATQVPRGVGEKYAMTLALSQKAVSDHLDQDPEIIQRLKVQKQQILAQAEYKKLADDIQVTPDDITGYFNAHKADFEQVEVRQISVRKKLAGAKPGVPGLSEAEARAKTEEIRMALAGGADAAKLADTYKTPPGAVHTHSPISSTSVMNRAVSWRSRERNMRPVVSPILRGPAA